MTADRSAARDPEPLSPTALLGAEHRQIEERLEHLAADLRRLGEIGPDDEILQRIEAAAAYIDDEMHVHHLKEEKGLFPFLEPHLEDEELHLDSRIADHEDLQIMNGKFKEALDDCRRRSSDMSGKFSAMMLKGYGLYIIHLVLEHLLKEDQILFLVADRYLTADQEAEILERFDEIERNRARL